MVRTTSAQSVQAKNSTKKNTLLYKEPPNFFSVLKYLQLLDFLVCLMLLYCSILDWV